MRSANWIALVPLVLTAAMSSTAAKQVRLGQGSVVSAVLNLKPGDFIWEPRLSPNGPLILVVNASTQRALLFRNGVPIAATTISTGRPGNRTPTGVFTILQKRVEHYSSKYDNAPMPYMQRLTWGGIALHAGNLPGYPASHGCIRLPLDFARKLYGATQVGMTVFITDRTASPRIAPSVGSVFQGSGTPQAIGSVQWNPGLSPSGPVSILVSASDRKAVVLRNGVVIGAGEVTIAGPVTGTFAYVLQGAGPLKRWLRLDLDGDSTGTPVERREWERFNASPDFAAKVKSVLQAGTTIVVTTDSISTNPAIDRRTIIEGQDQDQPSGREHGSVSGRR